MFEPREDETNRQAGSLICQRNRCTVQPGNSLDQAETQAAARGRPTLVHSVETLEYLFALAGGNSRAAVGYGKLGTDVITRAVDRDNPADGRVFDGVI